MENTKNRLVKQIEYRMERLNQKLKAIKLPAFYHDVGQAGLEEVIRHLDAAVAVRFFRGEENDEGTGRDKKD